MKKLLWIFVALVLLAGCNTPPKTNNSGASHRLEEGITEQNQDKLNAARNMQTFTDQIHDSTEMINLQKRILLFNDPNRISYVCEILPVGIVLACYTIRGKATFVSSALSTQQQIVKDPYCNNGTGYGSCGVVVESPQLDGSYGSNGDGMFWFDSNGAYHEWNGLYELSTVPFVINAKPMLHGDAKAYKVESSEVITK